MGANATKLYCIWNHKLDLVSRSSLNPGTLNVNILNPGISAPIIIFSRSTDTASRFSRTVSVTAPILKWHCI